MANSWTQRLLAAFVTFPAIAALHAAEPPVRFDTADGDAWLLAYIRRPASDAHRLTIGCEDDRSVLVLLNFSRETIEVQLPTSPAVAAIVSTNKLQNALTGEPVVLANQQARLKPFDTHVLIRKDSSCASVTGLRRRPVAQLRP